MNEAIGVADRVALDMGVGQEIPLHFTGHAHFELRGPDGELKGVWDRTNTITTAGKTGVAAQLAVTPAVPKWGWMAVGTGTPQATLLGAEAARVAFTTNTSATNVDTAVATFAPTVATGTLTEAGTFDVVTANTVNMWTYATIAITKGALDSLTITWTLTAN
jgi:hypothetical protein